MSFGDFISKWTLTGFLATWGALLSTFGFGWSMYRDLVDRARLRCSVRIRRIAGTPTGATYAVAPDLHPDADSQLYVVMRAVNAGRRRATWEGWGGKYWQPQNGKSGFYIIPRALPHMLNEGETHSEVTALEADLSPVNGRVRFLYAWDSTGKEYRLSRRQMKRLRREAEAARAHSELKTPAGQGR